MTVRFWDYAPANTTLRVSVRRKARREFPNPFEPPPPPPEPSPYDALDLDAQTLPPPRFDRLPDTSLPGLEATTTGEGPFKAPSIFKPSVFGPERQRAGYQPSPTPPVLDLPEWWRKNEEEPSAAMLWDIGKGRGLSLPSSEKTERFLQEEEEHTNLGMLARIIGDPFNLLPGVGVTEAFAKPGVALAGATAKAAQRAGKAIASDQRGFARLPGKGKALPPAAGRAITQDEAAFLNKVTKSKDLFQAGDPMNPTLEARLSEMPKAQQTAKPPAAESATAKAASVAAEKPAGVSPAETVPVGQARAPQGATPRQRKAIQFVEDEGIVDMSGNPITVDSDGTVTLYHRTTQEAADKIKATGNFLSKENTNETFFSNKPTGQAEGYGDVIVSVKVPVEDVRLNDAFRDEIHVAISNKRLHKFNVKSVSQAPPLEPVPPQRVAQGAAAIQPSKASPPRVTPGLQAAGEPPRGGEPPRLTAEQSDGAIRRFSEYLTSPKSEEAWTLTQELRKQERATRAKALQQRLDQLMGEGRSTEEAISQAVKETMSGRLPGSKGFSEVYADNMREALFAKVFHVLQGDEYELMSTSEALRNALLGKAIPRTPGAKGGSAYTRLLRVFGQDSTVMKMLEKAKKLEAQLDDALLHAPAPPWKDFEVPPSVPFGIPRLGEQGWSDLGMVIPNRTPAQTALAAEQLKIYLNEQRQFIEAQRKSAALTWDTWIQQRNLPKEFAEYPPESILHGGQQKALPGMEQADWQRTMMAESRTQEQLEAARWELSRQEQRAAGQTEFDFPPPAPSPTKPPVTESMIPPPQRNIVLRALKEAGLTIRDLGNFWRANKATLDNSWWRQNAMLLGKDRRAFWNATVESWKAMFQKDGGKASWEKIKNDPLFHFYEKMDLDFLRPPSLTPGQAVWRGVEEFGFTQAGRPLARLTGKLPWVKHPQRAFITGTNEHNWAIFKGFHKKMMEVNQELASGKIQLKPGESFSIERHLKDYGRMLEDMTGRAQLGPLKALSPAMNNGFFSIRFALSRGLVGRNLFSANPYVRKEAWNLFARFVGGITAIEMAGEQMGLWEIGKEKNSTLGKIRVGNTWIDPWGGHQQYVVFATRMLTETNTSLTGQEYPVSQWETFGRLVRGKEAPLGGFVTDLLAKQDYLGRKVDLGSGTQWAERIAPMVPWDAYEAFKESGPGVALATLPLSVQGIGVTSYSNPLDKLAQEKGQPDFRTLQETSPAEASQLKLSPEGRLAIREEGKVVTEQQKAKEAEFDRQTLDDEALQSGQITAAEWRGRLRDRRNQAIGVSNYREKMGEFADRPPKDDNEKALQGYYKLWQSFDEEQYGQYDKNGVQVKKGTGVEPPDINRRLDIYIAGLSEAPRDHLLKNLHPRATKKVQEYYKDMATLKPYWAMEEKMAQKNPMMADLSRKKTLAKANGNVLRVKEIDYFPGFKLYEKELMERKKMVRRESREIDYLLKKWGYTSSYLNLENKMAGVR